MLKLRDLRAVLAVAQTGSVRGATAQLNLSQPATTHAVKRVEDQLGVVLFERHHNGMKLTPLGRVVANRADRALRRLAFAGEEIARSSRPPQAVMTGILERAATRSQLQTLIEVADCKNIACAAKRMGVTQTVIYRHLREIEGIVGTSLFRQGDGFIPTPAAEILIRSANLAFAELRIIDEEIQHAFRCIAGKVVIGTLPSARSILVPKTIAQLSKQYPALKFALIDEPYDDLQAGLARGNIDVIVGSIRSQADTANVHQQVLFREPVTVISSAAHPLHAQTLVTLEDLSRMRWAMPRLGVPTRDYFEALFARAGIHRPNDIVESDSLIAIRSLMTEDNRLTLMSPYRADLELQIGLLKIVPFDVSEMSFGFGYMVRAQATLSPGVSVFIRTLHELSITEASRWNFGIRSVPSPELMPLPTFPPPTADQQIKIN